ncbi:uncharacterized protein LOC131530382 isoform X1 [Onychostoma macrolepis]|uniref:uncharacterized protein LOC131530382 isoform X1 n=1 Tax=Onychostoma macrolepis TaxID=369639 RepID=UPI00272D664A|nr:uncharacterized protein LOC131530382 isoform X1 [Onychostoma macrolepis]
MEQPKAWHPFRVPGLCGMRGTICWLTAVAMIICSISFYLTAELVQETRGNDMPTATISLNETNYQPSTRTKRSTLTIVVPMHGAREDFITVTEGSSVKFSCNPYMKNCQYCGRPARASKQDFEYAQIYFCKEPCGWGEVKAYDKPTVYGTDKRFGVTKNSKRGHNKDGMTVEIRGVRLADQGKYYCGIDKMGIDWYEAFNIIVNQPAPEPIKPLVEHTFEPATAEEEAWMGEGGAGKGGMNPEVRSAMTRCQGNKACTLALLQKAELEVNTSCWLCLQMSHSWRAAPLTVATVTETRCLIPQQMTEVLMAAADIEQGNTPKRKPALDCGKTRWDNKLDVMLPPLRVMYTRGDVCVCRVRPNSGVMTGWSNCRMRMDVRNGTTDNCTATINGTLMNFTCPFSEPRNTLPAAVWVCGGRAYHHLPERGWAGCCYPALMSVGTSVYLPGNEHEGESRKKRSVKVLPGALPDRYNGYVLSNPWMTPGANVGWSIFPGVGTALSINKINGLAWSVLTIANSTENALTMVNEEMKQIRDTVIQNRLALDLLTSEKGGVCKMLGTSCCFHIPDYSDNVTNIITHMRMAVKEPERANDVWLEWLTNLWGGWVA